MSRPNKAHRYTYADYLEWDGNERIELIDGEAVMQAAPSRIHQKVSGNLFVQLHNFLKGKPCDVYSSPFAVRLDEKKDNSDKTVVEPDIAVICDKSKLDDKGCNGAPDLIIEIISSSSLKHDKVIKFNISLQAGVREYWIVDPDGKTVSVHVLRDGEYVTRAYGEDDTAPVHVLGGCEINLSDAFAE